MLPCDSPTWPYAPTQLTAYNQTAKQSCSCASLRHVIYNMPLYKRLLCNSAALQHAYVPSHIMQHAALSPKFSDYITPELAPYGADVAPSGRVLAPMAHH